MYLGRLNGKEQQFFSYDARELDQRSFVNEAQIKKKPGEQNFPGDLKTFNTIRRRGIEFTLKKNKCKLEL